MLREGIKQVAGDEGLWVEVFGGHVSVSSAGQVSFKCGHELLVHSWCDVVLHGGFHLSCVLSLVIDNVT